jgi:hypothetical protein
MGTIPFSRFMPLDHPSWNVPIVTSQTQAVASIEKFASALLEMAGKIDSRDWMTRGVLLSHSLRFTDLLKHPDFRKDPDFSIISQQLDETCRIL